MNNRPVAFFDSGIGGLPYLAWFRQALPQERLLYCADTSHFPYGEKSAGQVREIVITLVEKIISLADPKLFVIACNTASVSSLAALRETFDLPFVGVVPAVKPAARISKKRTIGLMATDRTVEEAYTDNLIEMFAGDCKIMKYADGEIVDFVENRMLDAPPSEKLLLLQRAVTALKGVDAVVLACTHFIHLKDDLKALFGPDVEVVDSVEGVGRQAVKMTRGCGFRNAPEEKGLFYTTGGTDREKTYRRRAEQYGLSFMGVLD
ncbi:MAG: glutamate racemase [Spirochaetales bacterium]|nr:glutamate racemase [Spirochaetales bacterium]